MAVAGRKGHEKALSDRLDPHVARMLLDHAPNRGSRWNELASMESKSSRVDAGSAMFVLIREEAWAGSIPGASTCDSRKYPNLFTHRATGSRVGYPARSLRSGDFCWALLLDGTHVAHVLREP